MAEERRRESEQEREQSKPSSSLRADQGPREPLSVPSTSTISMLGTTQSRNLGTLETHPNHPQDDDSAQQEQKLPEKERQLDSKISVALKSSTTRKPGFSGGSCRTAGKMSFKLVPELETTGSLQRTCRTETRDGLGREWLRG